jgi:hypothetical protein
MSLSAADIEMVDIVMKNIEKNFPDFIDWLKTLKDHEQASVTRRMAKEGAQFTKDTMWGYPGYAAYRDTHRMKRNMDEEKEWDAQTDQEKNNLRILNRELAQKYGFDLEKIGIIKL